MRLLVQRGANINPGGTTKPLSWAIARGNKEMVAFLLEKGAHITEGPLSTTALMLASMTSHLGVARMLLEHLGGQGLDDRDEDGYTALHHAAWGECEKVVRFLLFAGADPTIRDNEGRTPQAIAEIREIADDETETDYERWAKCVAAFEWWEGQLNRQPLLERARCLHDASTTQRDTPTAPVPAFLQARVAAGQALPQVEVVAGQQEEQQAGASGKREARRRGREEERHAVLAYVVGQLNEELFTELLQGFHAPRLV